MSVRAQSWKPDASVVVQVGTDVRVEVHVADSTTAQWVGALIRSSRGVTS